MNINREMKSCNNKSAGFTVVELIIALLIAVVIASAAMAIYVTQHKQLIVRDQATDMQADLRSAAAELASKVRLAGYKVPDGLSPLEARNTNPDTITITYDGGGLKDVRVEHTMPQPSSGLRCDGHDISGLHENDRAYIWDPFAKTGEFFLVTDVLLAEATIQHNTLPLSRCYPAGSQVIKMKQFKYYLDNTDPDRPSLMMWTPQTGAQVYAENITDLNFRYVLSSGATVDVPIMPDMVREVIIEIDGRVDRADDGLVIDCEARRLETRVLARNLGIGSLGN
jgi:type II secretory pathway pseudopilin PulG